MGEADRAADLCAGPGREHRQAALSTAGLGRRRGSPRPRAGRHCGAQRSGQPEAQPEPGGPRAGPTAPTALSSVSRGGAEPRPGSGLSAVGEPQGPSGRGSGGWVELTSRLLDLRAQGAHGAEPAPATEGGPRPEGRANREAGDGRRGRGGGGAHLAGRLRVVAAGPGGAPCRLCPRPPPARKRALPARPAPTRPAPASASGSARGERALPAPRATRGPASRRRGAGHPQRSDGPASSDSRHPEEEARPPVIGRRAALRPALPARGAAARSAPCGAPWTWGRLGTRDKHRD